MNEAVRYTNTIQCNHCKDIITSTHRHDFRYCKCKKVAVDGGNDYWRRVGNRGDWTELGVPIGVPIEKGTE